MRPFLRYPTLAAILFGLFIAPGLAMAAPLDAKSIQVVVKTFDFLVKKPQDGAKIVVVSGAADLDTVKAALPKMSVSEGNAASAAGAFAIFVNSSEEALAARNANASIVVVGNNVSCADSGACLIVVETQPKVTIYVSHAAAKAMGIEFDANFKMLITER